MNAAVRCLRGGSSSSSAILLPLLRGGGRQHHHHHHHQCHHRRTLSRPAQQRALATATTRGEENTIRVSFVAGQAKEELEFPCAWLRDNCQCPECFHPVSRARHLLLRDVPPDVRPERAEVSPGGASLRVTWPGGHRSEYPREWLEERAFTEGAAGRRVERFQRKTRLWAAKDPIVRHDFSAIMGSDAALLSWLEDLDSLGMTLITGIPDEASGASGIISRIGLGRTTHYGPTWKVEDKGDPNNPAYTSVTLALHTDLPYYEYIPGAQFLHCVRQTDRPGGENQFVDGFKVAELLKERQPEEFRVLCETPVEWQDEGVESGGTVTFKKVRAHPTLQRDFDGRIFRINYSHQQRSSHQPHAALRGGGGAAGVARLYRALSAFDALAHSPELVVEHKMAEGECAAYDNRRVLHGRTGFDTAGGDPGGERKRRFLHGWYVDWDEIWSRINVIREQQNKAEAKS